MKTFAVMLLTDVGKCEYFFFLFFNLNSCCFLHSANNFLVFLVLVLHEILTEEMLCAASHFYTVICRFFYTLECVSGNLPCMAEGGREALFGGLRVGTRTGAGNHEHGTFFATIF